MQQLYFAEWERLWFMEVGFWQILFSIIFFAIMILWRPSEHFKRYGESLQLGNEDNEDMFDSMPKPDTMADDDMSDGESDDDSNDDSRDAGLQAKFTIDDEDDEYDNNNNNNTKTKKFQKVAEQFLGDNDEENQLAAQKMQ